MLTCAEIGPGRSSRRVHAVRPRKSRAHRKDERHLRWGSGRPTRTGRPRRYPQWPLRGGEGEGRHHDRPLACAAVGWWARGGRGVRRRPSGAGSRAALRRRRREGGGRAWGGAGRRGGAGAGAGGRGWPARRAGSWAGARTRSRPPQRGQARTSRSSTRRIRAAKVHGLGVPAARGLASSSRAVDVRGRAAGADNL